MFKKFTIKEYRFKEVSKKRGSIDYLLIDELGVERTVTAIAKLGWNNKIKSAHAIYQREIPLVEALFKASVKDTIEIDFTGYNKKHPRVRNSAKLDSKSLAYQTARDNSYSIDKMRLFQLFLISTVILIVISAAKSFF